MCLGLLLYQEIFQQGMWSVMFIFDFMLSAYLHEQKTIIEPVKRSISKWQNNAKTDIQW
jgi:hypothetical protein